MKHSLWKTPLVVCTIAVMAAHGGATTVTLRSDSAIWRIEPKSLTISAQPAEGQAVEISAGLDVTTTLEVASGATSASWEWPQWAATVNVETLPGNGLHVTISARKPQEFNWPLLQMPLKDSHLLFPWGEGLNIPMDDPFWQEQLADQEWDAAESMSMPLVGLTRTNHTLTWFTAQPLRTRLQIAAAAERLNVDITHSLHPKSRRLVSEDFFYLDAGTSVTAPSRHYRDWLVSMGEFKTLEEKAAEAPEVNRLKGALQVYLWGAGAFGAGDIEKPAQWKKLCETLKHEGASTGTLGHHLKQYFSVEEWEQVVAGSKEPYIYAYVKDQVAAGLTKALESRDFARGYAWDKGARAAAEKVIGGKTDNLSTSESLLFNSHLLATAMPGIFNKPETWGDGVSTRMLDSLSKAGFAKLRLCVDDHSALARRPWVAAKARELGWLVGTYDSYHSIHPTTAPAESTWSTAQMTQELFDTGGVQRADGAYLAGFKKMGRKLNPKAGRAFMEHRVAGNMAQVPYNYYFIDCDATGESYDDFNRLHPGSREDDIAERLRRLGWISKTFGCVVGSEGGNAFAAKAIHSAEGIFNPFFGWGDKDMEDPKSPYYRGRYYPPLQPDVFFKTALLKEKYQRIYYDPSVRLPMYALVFHDSVVATAHWNNAHFKWKDTQTTLALTELLYLAPPLVHLTPTELTKRQKELKTLYDVWSPLHENFGFTAMTDFRTLDRAGLVQESEFTAACRVIANFGAEPYEGEGVTVPGESALIIAPSLWPEGKTVTFEK